MNPLKYIVNEKDIRNLDGDKDVLKKLFVGKNPADHALELDFSQIPDPKVTMSTGIIFQEMEKMGIAKIIVTNHKYKDQLLANPAIKILASKGILEIK